ncbi:MAG TPA: PIN domain-containing protein [Thermoanaerobaculia bacterium]|nr:PIN domain-containing protein [Thermoanaerobaculia bacterium]
MIVVDTSVWIASFRSASSDEAQHLSALLESDQVALAAPVRIEILSGASLSDSKRLRRVLSALPIFFPTEATWELMDSWVNIATRAGDHFGAADLLIAALAAEQAASVWSLDSDFPRMAKLGFIQIYQSR